MAIHWQIPFKSRRTGTVYTVNIYDATYSGNPMVLKGGEESFVTEEDNTEDEFTPIRTQSGYLSIADDGRNAADTADFDYSALLPGTDTDRPVTLTKVVSNQTVVCWQGFMQAQTFGSKIFESKQIRQYPIQCALSILNKTEINYQHTAIENFAYLLNYIIDSIPTISISKIYVQGMTARDWLLKKIDWQNFVTEDEDGTLIARYNLYQCLQDMCQFWGWTARTYADCLYLTRADDTNDYERENWWELTKANLVTMAGGTAAGTQISNFPYVTIGTEALYASDDNDEYLYRGPNKVTVNSDINKAEDEVISIDTEGFVKATTAQGWGNKTSDDDGATRYTNDLLSLSLPLLTGTATSGKASFNIGRLFNYSGDSKNSYEDVPMIRMKAAYNGSVYASLQTVYEHCFSGDYLKLNCKTYHGYDEITTLESVTRTRIRIGIGKTRSTALWLKGGSNGYDFEWSSTETIIIMEVDQEGNVYIVTETGGEEYSHTLIQCASGLSGKLFIEILGAPDTPDYPNVRHYYIYDIGFFTVSHYHAQEQTGVDPDNASVGFEDAGTLKYVATNGTDVSDETDIDNIYGSSGQCAFGYGIVMNANGTYYTTHMEQLLANRMVSYWSQSKLSRVIDVLPNISLPVGVSAGTIQSGDISPLYAVQFGFYSHPIAISRQWRDDVVHYTLLQIPPRS